MSVSFSDLWEVIQQSPAPNVQDDTLKDSGEEGPGMRVVRTGLNLEGNFWDSFKSICNDAEGLSDLLDVPSHTIASWTHKIDELVQKVKQSDGDNGEDKNKLVGAKHEPLAGPEGNDNNADGPADTRPMP
jgi:hypothetical protein